MIPKYVIYSMKTKGLVLIACGLIGLNACQVGLSTPAILPQDSREVTPRTKGPTLDITPRTKGTTLLMGQVIWPAEAQPLDDTRFRVEILTPAGKMITETSADGRFAFPDLAVPSELRLIASSIAKPILKLKVDLQTSVGQGEAGLTTQITVESTAISALRDYAQQAESAVQMLSLEAFGDPAVRALMRPVCESMLHILSSKEKMDNLSQSLESQSEVRLSLEQSQQALEALQGASGSSLRP